VRQASRTIGPEGCQKARERGRQTTAILVTIRRPFGARVGVSPRRGCGHSGTEPWVPPAHLLGGLSSFGTVGGCAQVLLSAVARRASVQSVATHAQPRTRSSGI